MIVLPVASFRKLVKRDKFKQPDFKKDKGSVLLLREQKFDASNFENTF